MGLQFTGAYLGGALLPPVFGWLSPLTGLEFWPYFLLILFAGMIISIEKKYRRAGTGE